MANHPSDNSNNDQRTAQDPGFGQKFLGKTKRIINRDGTFNVKRVAPGTGVKYLYQHLINISWTKFFGYVLATYFVLNSFFATVYFFVGHENLTGMPNLGNSLDKWMYCFFFSVQTFTTVGYGAIAPKGLATSWIASFEALIGLLGFALATGLLYGRFSRPSAHIRFSKHALISPYKSGTALMFRIVNNRQNVLMEMQASIIFAMKDLDEEGQPMRVYQELPLERSKIQFFPMNWTLVHPITPESPIYGKTEKDLLRGKAELLILIKGFDDTFAQIVHSRSSYCAEEIVWGAKFNRIFHTDTLGDVIVEVDRLDEFEKVPLPKVEIVGKSTA